MYSKKRGYDLCIVIPTINKPSKLKNLLHSINKQNRLLNKKIEVIIIFQKKNILKNIFFEFKNINKINVINQSVKSLSLAKNNGIKNSNSELICFLDDDVSIDKNYIYNVLKFFKQNQNIQLLFGSIKLKNKKKYFSRYMTKYPSKINLYNMKKCLASAMIMRNDKNKIFFDLQFGLGSKFPSSEETDFVIQNMIKKKYIFYHPKIVVYHENDEFLDKSKIKLKKKFFSYGFGAGAIYAKYYKKSYIFKFLFLFELIKSAVGILYGIIKINKQFIFKHYYLLNGKINGFFQ